MIFGLLGGASGAGADSGAGSVSGAGSASVSGSTAGAGSAAAAGSGGAAGVVTSASAGAFSPPSFGRGESLMMQPQHSAANEQANSP